MAAQVASNLSNLAQIPQQATPQAQMLAAGIQVTKSNPMMVGIIVIVVVLLLACVAVAYMYFGTDMLKGVTKDVAGVVTTGITEVSQVVDDTVVGAETGITQLGMAALSAPAKLASSITGGIGSAVSSLKFW
jgi:hypothetical protein